jgi:hypothetical protein
VDQDTDGSSPHLTPTRGRSRGICIPRRPHIATTAAPTQPSLGPCRAARSDSRRQPPPAPLCRLQGPTTPATARPHRAAHSDPRHWPPPSPTGHPAPLSSVAQTAARAAPRVVDQPSSLPSSTAPPGAPARRPPVSTPRPLLTPLLIAQTEAPTPPVSTTIGRGEPPSPSLCFVAF